MIRCCYNNTFDEEFIGKSLLDPVDWPSTPPQWTNHHKQALLSTPPPSPDLTLAEIIETSRKFPIPFPIDSVRCQNLRETVPEALLETNINSTYPVIHEHVLHLCSTFLTYKRQHHAFYKRMSLLDFIDRLLRKRAVAFVGTSDHYLLLDGTESDGGWENVGTSGEQPPLILENCLSYDEMKLSAMLSVSSFTCFINNGNRRNRGIPEMVGVEESGVIMGVVGTRLPKRNVMEYREIVKSREQNTQKNGYGRKCQSVQRLFMEFYGDVNATYTELLPLMQSRPERYVSLRKDMFFDKLMFIRRISLSIDTLLIEANDRAKRRNTTAFVHVVGFGLGVWRICLEQNKLFCDASATRLEFLKDTLTHVSDVCFAYIGESTVGRYKDGDTIGGITVHINDRNPHEKLTGVHEGKLLVVSYAWDGNALPGNEFWFGSLDTSSDSAAASSTQVAELHNPHINGKVAGNNLRVATLKHGLLTFAEYQQLHKDD